MAGAGHGSPVVDNEELERERYGELLQELRTVLPGVQVLFGFLLTVPFSNRFADLDDLGRDLYAATLIGVSLSTTALMTPAAYHRLAPDEDRSHRIQVAVRLTLCGIGLLAVSLSVAVFVVVRFAFESTRMGFLLGGIALVAFVALWLMMPLAQRRSDRLRTPSTPRHRIR